MSNDNKILVPNPARSYETGYGRPPRNSQFGKGQSGNPKGRPKKPQNLPEMFEAELYRVQPVTISGRRQKLSPKELMVKSLVTKAAQGDKRALSEIVALAATYGEGATKLPSTIPFWDALGKKDWYKLTDAFFEKQDKDIAAWKKATAEALPVGVLLKRELGRKVEGTRKGEPAKVRMREVIVARFMRAAMDGDVSVLRLLLELVPEKKLPKFPVREVIPRPTPAEKETRDQMLREEAEQVAAVMAEIKGPLSRRR